jgi:UDP-glucose 4-epimerase
MQTIVITGASGFIGTELSEHLASRNFRVIGIDNRNENERLREIGPNYEHHKIDLLRKNLIEDLFSKLPHPDLVIHLAGITRVKDAKNNPIASIESNVLAAINIFLSYQTNSQKNLKKGSFLLISTSELDNISRLLAAPSVYSITKQCAEDLIKSIHNPKNLNVSILRLCTVYGGEMELKDKLPRIFIEKAIKNEQLKINSNIKFNPSFIFIKDLLNIIEKISLELISASRHYKLKTYAVIGEEASLREIVDYIQEISSDNINFAYENSDERKLDSSHENISYEYKKIRPNTPIRLKDGLKVLWNISKKQIDNE